MKSFTFSLLFLCASLLGRAQENDSAPSFTPQIGLITTTVPTLQTTSPDSSFSNSFVIAPVLGVLHKSGFGVQYKPYYVSGNRSGIYMHAFTALFEQYDKPSFNLNVSYTHFIFTNKTGVPYSPLSNELYAYTSYKKVWLNPVLASSLGFGMDTNHKSAIDFSVSGGVGHSFSWEGDKVFSSVEVEPSLLLNAGTNRYYSFLTTSKYITNNKKYKGYINSKGRSKGKNNSGNGNSNNASSSNQKTTNAGPQAQTENFHISNIEVGFYSRFTIGNFTLSPSGGIFLPLVKASETGMTAYWQLQVGYGF